MTNTNDKYNENLENKKVVALRISVNLKLAIIIIIIVLITTKNDNNSNACSNYKYHTSWNNDF